MAVAQIYINELFAGGEEEERGRPVRRPDKYTGRKYKGRLDVSNEERRAIKREEKIEKKISDVGGRRSKRRTQEDKQGEETNHFKMRKTVTSFMSLLCEEMKWLKW